MAHHIMNRIDPTGAGGFLVNGSAQGNPPIFGHAVTPEFLNDLPRHLHSSPGGIT
jgi:hypothetical protein